MKFHLSVKRFYHTELHAAHGSQSTASFGNIKACEPSKEIMDTLAREMEDMFVEDRLQKEGPIRPLWEAVIAERRKEQKSTQNSNAIKEESSSVTSPPFARFSVSVASSENQAGATIKSGALESPETIERASEEA